MNINLIAVGNKMPTWIETATHQYVKRFSSHFDLKIIQVPQKKRFKNSNIKQLVQKESDKIMAAIPAHSRVIALDEGGSQWRTQQLAQQLSTWHDNHQDISLLIGGADGLSKAILKQAADIWSLSMLTLPHGLVRVMVAEQLYRAWSIIVKHPYHRE